MNNGPTVDFGDIENNGKVAVNSIQRSLYVERLYVDIHYPASRIIPYDVDNLYPNKIKSIAQRSGTTMSAISKLTEFIAGDGFDKMDTIINRDGGTLFDLLIHVAYSMSMFGGVSAHMNYNLNQVVTEINNINFEFPRWAKIINNDANAIPDKFIVNPRWGRSDERKYETTYNQFDPENVRDEIKKAGGIDKYNGQLFYWIPNKTDWYTVCEWDAVLDDAQFEAESKLYSLSSVQNDYSLSGIISYPSTLDSNKETREIITELKKDTGADNAGGVRVVPAPPVESMQRWTWFTPISRNNIDTLHTNQKNEAKLNIYARFNQPPILSGVATEGMFNEASYADAFNYYNAATETKRKIAERIINKILENSIWAKIGPIEIKPKEYVTRESKRTAKQEEKELTTTEQEDVEENKEQEDDRQDTDIDK